MQSDGNSFCGDVDLDSFNKASQDEDKYVRIIIMEILILYSIMRKYIWVPCCYVLHSLNVHFLQLLLYFEIFIIKIPKYLLFIFFVSNAIILVWPVKAVQDYIFAKTIPIWLHHTVDDWRKYFFLLYLHFAELQLNLHLSRD